MSSSRQKQLFFDSLLRTRRNSQNIQTLYHRFERARTRKRPTIIKGVHKGNYFRVKVPPKKSILPEVPKIPSPVGPALKSFKSVPPPASSTTTTTASAAAEHSTASTNVVSQASQKAAAAATAASSAGEQASAKLKKYLDWAYAWWKENWSILTMNFGSLCTLLAFTRSDVLELRALSVSGSVCFIIYTVAQKPIRWLTVGWTTLFGSVNSYKILQIINERHSHVTMTKEQEESYEKFFMPNGITPKQFEAIEKRAQRIFVKKNEPLIKQGSKLEYVYLVIEGSTRASVMGRYLTVASVSSHPEREVPEAGNAGAWVGEMAFLESSWGKDTDHTAAGDQPNSRSDRAMYTVVAKEDCVVWRWSHEDMAALMDMSSDMNAALTRAMTSAIVGKVIGFTTSRQSARPSWQTFLDGWKHTPAPMAKNVAESATQVASVSAPVTSLVKTKSVRKNSTKKVEKKSEDDEDVDETAKAGYPKEGSRSSDGTPSPA